MEPQRDPYVQYSELLVKAFEKIKKTVPKKYKELKEICNEAIEKIKLEKEGPYDANKYFYILKMALDTKITKLMEHILYIIQKLISYEFLDGNCEDNCIYPEDQKPPTNNGRLPRRLIDAIIESICSCVQDRDNQVQLQIIKVLLTIVTTFNTSTNAINQNTAKASLTQMINIVFSKMEAYSGNFGTSLKKLQQRQNLSQKVHISSIGEEETSQSNKHSDKSGKQLGKSQSTLQEEEKDSNFEISSKQELDPSLDGQNVLVNFSASDQYIYQVVQNIVDDVCLYQARTDQIRNKYYSQINDLENSADIEEKQTLDELMRTELESISLRSVPWKLKKGEEAKSKKQVQVDIKNEQGIPSGKFGWCIVCRNQANLYCKDTRHPVCSFECKQKHINLIDSIQAPQIEGLPNFYDSEEARRHLNDAIIVFKSICKLCLKDIPNQNLNTFTMRSKILGLELILAVVEKPGTTFLNKKDFIDIIKDTLCDGLLKYSVSNEKTIFALSLSIFYCLFLHFREHLKQEIVVFIEQIFLKILDSGNSNYHHKYLILNVFDKLSQNTKHLLEIFINYDCDEQQKDIFERMIDSLSKIAQGKFLKSEHSNIIQPSEEYSLRLYAIQILVQMLRNINQTIEAENAEFKLAQREVSQSSNKRDSSIDNHGSDDEDHHQIQIDNAINQLDKFQRTRLVKNEMLKAAIKFNLKPKNGIIYLMSKGFITKEPQADTVKDITNFLKTTSSLDKTKIGEYLGEDIELNKAVLYYFIDSDDFVNVPFVESLKRLLSSFRLPGEGQKVDRIMEKFGEKFTKDNPDSFGSAECVYLLSYATIMLQTTIHNPQASKTQMNQDDFLKITKGINGGKDLDRDFIINIYETVEKEPFTLAEDEDARLKQEATMATSFKRKQDLFIKEAQGLVKRGAALIKQKGTRTQFILVNDTEPIRPMFENTWSANLAVFSVILEETDDPKLTELCIEGFKHAIKISGFYSMHTERDAFVSSLSKFTQVSASKEIKEKNIQCIKALLNLATYDGNYLKNSWFYVLDCISKIDYMHVLGSGAKRDIDFFNQKNQKVTQKNNALARQQREQALIQNSELIVQYIDLSQIDLIIQRSVQLDAEAIIDFITNLCLVSKEELLDVDNPRKFSLQRLVEVADFNMGRIRFVWAKIWQNISEHFSIVGSHQNLHVAIYAIDSLRQLADKFLLKEEFGHYHFQKDFLKPFETIMLNNLHTRLDVKEYIVMCISQMCKSKLQHIKSGWSIIINIFTLAAQDSEEHLVIQSFEALKFAMKTRFQYLEDNFVELVNCLNKYSKNNFLKQSIEALDLLEECALHLATRREIIQNFIKMNGVNFYQRDKENSQRYPAHYGSTMTKSPSKSQKEELKSARSETGEGKVAGDEQPDDYKIRHSVMKGLWFPILTNLTNLIMEKRKEVQDRSFEVLFKIFNDYSNDYTEDFWREVFTQIILPLLEDIHLAVEIPSKKQFLLPFLTCFSTDSEFYRRTIEEILDKMNNFLLSKIDQLQGLIPSYIDMLALFISNINEKHIAQVTISQFKIFIISIGKHLSGPQWNQYIGSLSQLFENTTPTILLEEKEKYQEAHVHGGGHHKPVKNADDLSPRFGSGPQNLPQSQRELTFNQDACFTKCIVQLLLISTAQETVERFYEQLSLQNLNILLECLDKSYKFAREFNQELGLRLKLWKEGFMADLKQLPGLTAQERESISTYLTILFKLYFSPKEGQSIEGNSKSLFELCSKVLKDYCLQQSELVSINNSKQEENNHIGDVDDEEDEEEKEPSLSNLHENELERQLQNLTPIVSNIILANLLKLSEDDLRKHVKDIGPLLIDLSLCNNYEIRLANKELLSFSQRQFALYRKAKTFKLSKYPCIPEWMTPGPRDPFDYKLRSKEEVREQQIIHPPDFNISVTYKNYSSKGDTSVGTSLDNRERVAKIKFDLRQFHLAPLQRQRFVFLLGPRYQNSHIIKLVCSQYNTFQENLIKVNEILREIYWESLRAPTLNTTMLNNPYRREFIRKKFLGKTKEERLIKMKELDKKVEERKRQAFEQEIGFTQQAQEKSEKLRYKRKNIAQKRKDLGFDDLGKEEVEDPIIEELEIRDVEYRTHIAEQKERKTVKLVTEIKAISKDEINELKLTEDEKFRSV